MRHLRFHAQFLLSACVLLTAVPALAQTPDVRAAMRAALTPGDRVWIETTDGQTYAGRLSSLVDDAIVLSNGVPMQSIRFDAVRRVEGRDRVTNGVRNGVIVGAAAGAGFGIFLSRVFCEVDDCGDQLRRDLPAVFLLAGIGAGGGGLLGWAIDHAVDGRRIIYERRTTTSMSFTPLLSKTMRGISATISWR